MVHPSLAKARAFVVGWFLTAVGLLGFVASLAVAGLVLDLPSGFRATVVLLLIPPTAVAGFFWFRCAFGPLKVRDPTSGSVLIYEHGLAWGKRSLRWSNPRWYDTWVVRDPDTGTEEPARDRIARMDPIPDGRKAVRMFLWGAVVYLALFIATLPWLA